VFEREGGVYTLGNLHVDGSGLQLTGWRDGMLGARDGVGGWKAERQAAPGGRLWADGGKQRAVVRHIAPFGRRSPARYQPPHLVFCSCCTTTVQPGSRAINTVRWHAAHSSAGSPTQLPTGRLSRCDSPSQGGVSSCEGGIKERELLVGVGGAVLSGTHRHPLLLHSMVWLLSSPASVGVATGRARSRLYARRAAAGCGCDLLAAASRCSGGGGGGGKAQGARTSSTEGTEAVECWTSESRGKKNGRTP